MRTIIFYLGEFNPRRGKFLTAVARYKPSDLLGVYAPDPDHTLIDYCAQNNIKIYTRLEDLDKTCEQLLIGNLSYDYFEKVENHVLSMLAYCSKHNIRLVNGTFTPIGDYFPNYSKFVWDIRKHDKFYQPEYFKDPLRSKKGQLRVLTVGMDSAIGKMTVALEIEKRLLQKKYDAKFIATGQIGIFLKGEGFALDSTIIDFSKGMLEDYLAQQGNKILIIEGQGSIYHPVFFGAAMSLVYGGAPHKMIMCAEAGVKNKLRSVANWPTPSIKQGIADIESLAKISIPEAEVIGVALDTSKLTQDEAISEIMKLEQELGLPVTDVIRFGADKLIKALDNSINKIIHNEEKTIPLC